MRFLADESCDYAVVRALRAEGHDVLAVSEIMQRSVDRDLLELAKREHRILLTEDKDFGWLVFVSQMDSPGVVLIRFPGNARRSLVQTLVNVVNEQREALVGVFVVIQPGHIRISQRFGVDE